MEVYLDNGATTRVDPEVVKEMQPFFSDKYGNASSLHKFGREAKEALENARETIAISIGAEPKEIIFTSGGTESDNMALRGAIFCGERKGKNIITTKIEHPAILNTCKCLEQQGVKVHYLDVDKNGVVDLEQVKKLIDKNTLLVSIMHANNEVGTIQPIKQAAKIAHDNGTLFHTDAVQSFTKTKFDVKELGVDYASFSGHKIHGPKGVGFLYKSKKAPLCPMVYGGGHEFSLRAGTENVPAIVGLAKAVSLDTKSDYIRKLRDRLIKGLETIPDVKLNGPRKQRLVNNVNMSFAFVEGEAMLLHLDEKGIAVSTGSACSSHSLKPSHVLEAIGVPPDMMHGSLRFTLSRFNTEKEIDYTIKSVKEVVEKLRKISPFGKR